MKRVVYLLGAGFSAPLGLPVMADFLEKAKYQYQNNPELFQHFGPFLDRLSLPHIASSYFATDVFNIEDILSILDMKGQLEGEARDIEFRRFISDVIAYHTPETRDGPTANDWASLICGAQPWTMYGMFVICLLGHEFTLAAGFDGRASRPKPEIYSSRAVEKPDVAYSILTMNYDRVLEIAADYVQHTFGAASRFSQTPSTPGVPLIKLHGGMESDDLVPPIWSKSLVQPGIRKAWKWAYECLKAANEIRILGYSLPPTDNYVRYLLRAAAAANPNLQRIDVLCKDSPTKAVEENYRTFVRLPNFRFAPESTVRYLMGIHEGQWPQKITPALLEKAHNGVFV